MPASTGVRAGALAQVIETTAILAILSDRYDANLALNAYMMAPRRAF
jgi:hypothetical protein